LPTLSKPSWDLGRAGRCLVIGEVAQAHDGSLGMAHAFIDAIARAGADAVKFQTHIADAESTGAEPWRVRFSLQDTLRRDYWRRMEFTEDQWHGLMRHATDCNLLFLASPFSIAALDLLSRVGVSAWKVASGELENDPLTERMVGTGLPIFLSTGMHALSDVDRVVAVWQRHRHPFALLQCTSEYPCPPERVGLNVIPLLRTRYGCPVGLSDHSGTIFPALAAATLGISLLEVHVALSREMFGPDVSSSVTTTELHQLVEGIRFIETMMRHPIDKDAVAETMKPVRAVFTKSVVPSVDLPAGLVLRPEHLAVKKPGTGIPASRLADLLGMRLKRDLRADELLREDDLEQPVGP
jgi:N,N'-diacetyllegionaminate synthase